MPRPPASRSRSALWIIFAAGLATLCWWAYSFHGTQVAMPSAEPDTGAVWLGDFESPSGPGQGWRARGAEADPTTEHATHGRLAVRLRFPASRSPAFRLELRASDWAPFGTLEFDLASGARRPQRILVRLTDESGGAYQEEVHLQGGASQHVSVDLDDARLYFDLGRVTELSFFQWRPPEAATFYLDGVVLRPRPASAGEPVARRSEPKPRGVSPTERWQPGWVGSLVKLSPDPAHLEGLESGPVSLSLARGERESAQIVLVGARDRAVRVSLSVGSLRATEAPRGPDVRDVIPAEAVEVRRVAWVRTRKPSYPVVRVGDWPDPLPFGSEVDVPAGALRAFWITVRAPADQPAGAYTGALALRGSDGRTETVEVVVRIRSFKLPRVPSLKTAFELDRGLLARGYREFVPGGDGWTGRLEELERLYVLDMLDHRISPILNADPEHPRFAEDLRQYRDQGLTSFGVGTHGGNYSNNWPEDEAALTALMGWYRSAGVALRAQGWLDHAYVYAWDEPRPGLPRVERVLGALRAAAPDLRRLLALDEAPDPAEHASWLRDADILCLRVTAWDAELARAYRSLGKELWLYVATPSPPRPALVVDYPAMAHRILPWMCRKLGASGLLFWSVNFWRVDPWKDTNDFVDDQNLAGTLYYPGALGPVPSIRLEVLRDGMEDHDYLSLLEELVIRGRAGGFGDGALLDEAEALARVPPELVRSPREFSRDPAALLARREAVAGMIERLSSRLPRPIDPDWLFPALARSPIEGLRRGPAEAVMRQRSMSVAFWTLLLGGSVGSAASVAASEPEKHLFVWAGDQARRAADFLAVVDFDEDSASYGALIRTVPLPSPGEASNEPHHVGLSADGRVLACGGLLSVLQGQKEIFFFDVSNPARPRFLSASDPPQSSITDEFYPLQGGGFLVTMMGGSEGHHPGRVVEFDRRLRVVAEHPAEPPADGFNPHGISVRPEVNLMVTSDFICPSTTLHGSPGGLDLRGSVRVWNFRERRILRTVTLPNAAGSIDVRLIPCDSKKRAYTAGMTDDTLYLVDTRRGTAQAVFDFRTIATGGWPQLMRMTRNGRRLFVSMNTAGKIAMLDTSDPRRPRLLSVLDLGADSGPHYIALTRDEKRLVITDYFLNEDDAGKVHAEGDHKVHVAVVSENDLALDPRFQLDFNTVIETGPARPHGVAFK